MHFAEQLLHAMHDADPSLVRRTLFFKHDFTVQELQQRVEYAKYCLKVDEEWPAFLAHTIYIDESSFRVDKYTESDVWVWCNKHDLNFSDVVPRKLKKGNKSVTVKFIVAVTAHLQKRGVWCTWSLPLAQPRSNGASTQGWMAMTESGTWTTW
jgi:hypothetical protein